MSPYLQINTRGSAPALQIDRCPFHQDPTGESYIPRFFLLIRYNCNLPSIKDPRRVTRNIRFIETAFL